MRHLIMTLIVLISSPSFAVEKAGKAPDLSQAIKEASLSQKLLHRRLLRILQGTEYAIAKAEAPAQALQGNSSFYRSSLGTEAPDRRHKNPHKDL